MTYKVKFYDVFEIQFVKPPEGLYYGYTRLGEIERIGWKEFIAQMCPIESQGEFATIDMIKPGSAVGTHQDGEDKTNFCSNAYSRGRYYLRMDILLIEKAFVVTDLIWGLP
jgi:hypothetical protein